jgi:glycosyltransferase involved in cell wall biosynthesis
VDAKASAVVVDDGEPNLERCISSLRNQSFPLDEIILASGPKTDLDAAKKLADHILEPIEGIGKARVQAILEAESDYILSCDGDTVYDVRYAEFALEDLWAGAKAVRAGVILPLSWENLLSFLETAFQLIPPYEYALAFRKSAFLNTKIHLEDYSNPRTDIGIYVITRLGWLPDFRMMCWTRLPTYWAVYMANNYLPSALVGLTPLVSVTSIVGANELIKSGEGII